MKAALGLAAAMALARSATADGRVFVTKADGTLGEWGLDLPEYHLTWPQSDTFWGPSQQGGGWTIDEITRCQYGYSLFPNRFGTVPPKDLDTSGRVEINCPLGEWGYIWLQFHRNEFGQYRPETAGTLNGLVMRFDPLGGAQFDHLLTVFYNPASQGNRRWDGGLETFLNQNPTRLIAITSGGIQFGPTCAAWNLYCGPEQVCTALLGAVDCVKSPGVQDFDIVIAAINLVSGQVQGPLHAARVRFICTLVGDLNCDAHVDFGDINPFVLALTNPAGYELMYPNCYIKNADINRDTRVDFGDINAFVRLLTNP